jgi:hypothetical protein
VNRLTFETDTEPYAKTRDAKVTYHYNGMFNYLNIATVVRGLESMLLHIVQPLLSSTMHCCCSLSIQVTVQEYSQTAYALLY